MVIEISVAIIAIAFVILAIYLALLANSLRKAASTVQHLMDEHSNEIGNIIIRTSEITENVNQISFDAARKMDALQSTFNAIADVGNFLEKKTNKYKKKADYISEYEDPEYQYFHKEKSSPITDILDLTRAGIHLWKKLKKGARK